VDFWSQANKVLASTIKLNDIESMGKRRVARERAVQFLFQYDLNPSEEFATAWEHFWTSQRISAAKPEQDQALWGQPLPQLPPETTEESATRVFAETLVKGVLAARDTLDEQIVKHTKNWDIHRMAVVDRNVLRLAIYEMLHRDDIPPIVSINEAVDIAKRYSTEESGKFVNGILDKIRGELLRPARIVTH
jgi:transcription antitermination protein NusB